MKRRFKQVLSLALVLCMVFSLMCINISAASTTTGTKPDDGTTTGQPFSSGTGGSTYFRIPAMVTLDDGTIVAACDARWDGSSDGYGLDTIVSRSTDGGETWSYTFANYLGDNGNALNSSSTAFIDPCLATDGETVYMLVDLYPGGTVISNAQAGTGYDSDGHLMLKASGSSSYDYYLGDFGSDGYAYIYNYSSGEYVGGYTVDQWFNVYIQGTLESNLFYSDCAYTVLPTSYLYLTTSTDGGATWSAPTMLNSQVKNSDDEFYGVGPGSALVTSTGRIIFSCYTYVTSDGNTSVIYSDDGGKTWTRSADMSEQSSEATMVEADGTIYMFTRHGGYYYSTDNGTTWSSKQTVSGISYTTSCQINAMVYSQKIDGCTAILLSAPTSNRTTGKIFVGLVQDDGSISWAYTYSVNGSNTYQYSCMAELSDGTVALLYESGSAAITYTTLDIKNIASGAEIGSSETTVTDATTRITATADGLTAISVTKGNATTNDDGSVSIAYDITLNGGAYTGAATVTVPVDDAFADCTSFSAVVYNDNASNTDTVGVTVSGSNLVLSVPHFSTVLVTGATSGTTTVTETKDVTVYVGYTTTITDETGNYESVYNASGLDTNVATVTVTGTTTEASSTTTYSGTKVTSATSGSTYYVGDGTNYLVLSGSTLSTTTDITQATAFTWTENSTSYGPSTSTSRYLSSGSNYLRYNNSAWSTATSTSGSSSATNFSSYSGTLSYTDRGQTTSTGYSLYTMTESTETVEGVDATTIAITGVAVGTTSVVVGNTLYNITVVEAPTAFTGTVSIAGGESATVSMSDLNSSYALSDGQYVEWTTADSTIADIYSTSDSGTSIIGHKAGTTTVTATVYNEDGTEAAVYTWTVTVTSTSSSTGSSTINLTATVTVTNGRIYYSVTGTTVQEATLVSETTDANGNTVRTYSIDTTAYYSGSAILCYFVAPDEGYALTSISDDGTTYGQYYVLDPETNTVKVGSGHQGGTLEAYMTDAEIQAMVAQAVAYGCEVIYWNTRSSSDSFTYSNYCNKLPTVSKEITKVNDETYVEGETEITVGDTITYTVTVTTYYENVNITYSNATLTDTMSTGANGTPSWTSQTLTSTQMGNSTTQSSASATAATYTVTYTVQEGDVDSEIVNTVSLSYDYYTSYEEGSYGGSASADCAVTIVSFYPDDIVVDFGLPVTIDYSESHGTYDLDSGTATYGTVTISENKITYTPNTVLTGVDTVTVTNTKGVEYTFNVYPATTVYYEEGFATYGTGWSVTGTGSWESTGTAVTTAQQTHIANSTTSYNNYNYDSAYDRGTGSAMTTAASGDSLTFTFTGTGVDIFANRTSSTGIVMIKIANSNGTTEKMLTVDTVDAGTYNVDGATAYNSPIASVSNLTYGTHTVTIYVAEKKTFNFDGFRVYDTIDQEKDDTTSDAYTIQTTVYEADNEDYPVYYELRNNVLAGLNVSTSNSTYASDIAKTTIAQVYATGTDNTSGAVVYYSGSGSVLQEDTDVQTLLDGGPKNELYLYPGMTVIFTITTNREVQIGLRSVTGDTVSYTVNSGSTQTISSSVDMFYTLQSSSTSGSVTYTITVPETSSGILSITDIKVCDSTDESVFGELTEADLTAALVSLGYAADETTADAALTVDLVDYTGSVVASTELTDTGIVGDSAAFSAADILAAVNEALPDGYAIVDEDSLADQSVAYGDTGSVNVQIGKVATLTVTFQKYSGLFRKTTVATVTLTKVQTGSASRATFSSSEIKAAVPSGYKALLATSATVSYGSSATKTVTVY